MLAEGREVERGETGAAVWMQKLTSAVLVSDVDYSNTGGDSAFA